MSNLPVVSCLGVPLSLIFIGGTQMMVNRGMLFCVHFVGQILY